MFKWLRQRKHSIAEIENLDLLPAIERAETEFFRYGDFNSATNEGDIAFSRFLQQYGIIAKAPHNRIKVVDKEKAIQFKLLYS